MWITAACMYTIGEVIRIVAMPPLPLWESRTARPAEQQVRDGVMVFTVQVSSRKADGSTVSPEVTLCHKYQTVKMAFEGPKRGFADFTLKSFSRVATNQSMFAFSFPVGTEVGCRTYVGDDYNQIFVRRGCTVDSGKREGEIAWYDLG